MRVAIKLSLYHCSSYSTAVVIPYRDREANLRVALPYLHRFLQRQEIHYKIYVVSQAKFCQKGKLVFSSYYRKTNFQSTEDGLLFNRGGLFNVGFLKVLRRPDI